MSKICVITSSRADYGLLSTLIGYLHKARKLQLVVSGSHFSKKHGSSVDLIKYPIAAKIPLVPQKDTNLAMAETVGEGVIKFAKTFAKLKPDLVVVLGDRYEIFAAAQAAFCLKIPIAHLHGGEVTEGALDDGFRNAISKLSTYHFVSHPEHKKRLEDMGEKPQDVHFVGAPGLDLINPNKVRTRAELEKKIGTKLPKEYFLVTYHPATLDKLSSEDAMKKLLKALSEFPEYGLLVTKANADPEGEKINKIWAKQKNVILVSNLGSEFYHAAIKHSAIVIGNSSSGVIEVPYFKKAVVNIGNRQKGRMTPNSVITCGNSAKEIELAIYKALKTKPELENIYGIPGKISEKIYNLIKKI